MTTEEIYNVEEFLKSIPSNIPIHSIETIRNPSRAIDAPKFLTLVTYEDPLTKELYVAEKNSLKILRIIKQAERYRDAW